MVSYELQFVCLPFPPCLLGDHRTFRRVEPEPSSPRRGGDGERGARGIGCGGREGGREREGGFSARRISHTGGRGSPPPSTAPPPGQSQERRALTFLLRVSVCISVAGAARRRRGGAAGAGGGSAGALGVALSG
ncbi:unnamed protein product [Pleuronectes platessa]|uniref:Uncharacterized protein n=1 Tax=Pleuronectes platessa TaxID=8262 RepID=A0A9N7UQ80_PLEPL|nr:unnamed protein product [Pleuronectes platessa]